MSIKILLTALLLGLSIACSSGWNSPNRCLVCYPARSGEHLATLQETNDTFAIRTLVFRERTFWGGSTLLGTHYVFETKGRDEESWREFMSFLQDDPEPINGDRSKFVRDRVTFVNDQVAFVYMGWMYAITTNGGQTWDVWNGLNHPLEKGRIGFNAIQDVKLLENGSGTMNLALIGNDGPTVLHTKDYGISWVEEGKATK